MTARCRKLNTCNTKKKPTQEEEKMAQVTFYSQHLGFRKIRQQLENGGPFKI